MDRAKFARIVGDNMRRYRKDFNLTQEKFSEQVGLSKAFCSAIECGAKIPSAYTVQIMAAALNISPLYFFIEPSLQPDNEKKTDDLLDRIIFALKQCSPDHLHFIEDILYLTRKYEIERKESSSI